MDLNLHGHHGTRTHDGSESNIAMKMDPLKRHFLLNMGIFHCYVRLAEGADIYQQKIKSFNVGIFLM